MTLSFAKTSTAAGTNWSGNVAYGPREFLEPTSVTELAGILRGARTAKALGTRHCFNRIADTGGVLISTRSLPRPIEIDSSRRIVRTCGGIRYGDLARRLQVCELRTVAADGLWLSAAYETDVLGIHFTWRPDEAAVAQFLPALESALAPFEARPHWGKLFDVDTASERLPSLYPGWEQFRELRRELDPSGKFLNDFLRCLKL